MGLLYPSLSLSLSVSLSFSFSGLQISCVQRDNAISVNFASLQSALEELYCLQKSRLCNHACAGARQMGKAVQAQCKLMFIYTKIFRRLFWGNFRPPNRALETRLQTSAYILSNFNFQQSTGDDFFSNLVALSKWTRNVFIIGVPHSIKYLKIYRKYELCAS